jgi:hypothetical protein
MIQIEHAPYRRPQNPLDLVIVEIIFWVSLKLFDTHLRLLGAEHRLVTTFNLPREHVRHH